MEKTIHHGRNVKRFREMLGLKQEGLAYLLGEDWNQKKISTMEQKEMIDDKLLEDVAAKLKVPVEAIKNFDEEAAIINIQNNYEGSTLNHSSNYQYNHQPTFNPLDKLMEVMDENKRLNDALLKEKDDKIALLERMAGMGK